MQRCITTSAKLVNYEPAYELPPLQKLLSSLHLSICFLCLSQNLLQKLKGVQEAGFVVVTNDQDWTCSSSLYPKMMYSFQVCSLKLLPPSLCRHKPPPQLQEEHDEAATRFVAKTFVPPWTSVFFSIFFDYLEDFTEN
jgi:hypothetical protein